MRVYTNGGYQEYNQVGTIKLFPFEVFYNPASIANILALADIARNFRVTMDTGQEHSMTIHFGHDQEMKFKQCQEGLYRYFFHTSAANKNNYLVNAYSFLSTVKKNKAYFHRTEVEGADTARDLQGQLAWPSDQKYKNIVKGNQLRNCPVTVSDIDRAHAIYIPALPILEGKTIRKRPEHIRQIEGVPLPLPIADTYKNITILMDYFFVNKRPFSLTRSEKIDFYSVQACIGRGKVELKKGLVDILKHIYNARGFDITLNHGDNDFEKVRTHLLPATLSIFAAKEHVGGIERPICTIKERIRCSCHVTPYKQYTKLIVKAIVQDTIHWLNAFPSDTGISDTLSPAAIVRGIPNPDYNAIKITFGSFVQVHVGTDNTTKSRSVGAIALRAANERGEYYFMSLLTGKQLHAYNWTELPIDDCIINRVETMAKDEKQLVMTNGYPIFEWAPGVPILDADEDEDEVAEAMEGIVYDGDTNSEHDSHDKVSDDDDNSSDNSDSDDDGDSSDDSNSDGEDKDVSDDNEADNISIEEEGVTQPEDDSGENKEDDNDDQEPITSDDVDPSEVPETEERSETQCPRRANAGKGVDRINMNFKCKSYDKKVQLTSTKGKK